MDVSRRHFCKLVGASAGAAVVAPRIAMGKKKKYVIPLSKVPKLKRVGGWTRLKTKNFHAILMRVSTRTVKAGHAICTHAPCALLYHHPSKEIRCPCHPGAFDLKGKVVRPPPTVPLPMYKARLKGKKIILEI